MATENFKAGQVWNYATRNGEESSTLTILKIEKYDNGDIIVHIRVDSVKIHSAQSATGYTSFIGHLPYSEKAISNSITKLAGQNENLPDFSEGYNQWKEAWVSGKGGYWTVALKQAIDSIDKAMKP